MITNLTDGLRGLTTERLTAGWADYGPAATAAALSVVLCVLAVSFIVARRRGHAEPWIANMANVLVLTLTSEGMFMFALNVLNLPWQLAACVFVVGEMALVSQAMAAKRHLNAARTELAGEMFPGAAAEAVKRHRHMAARHKTAVWVIAATVGAIVAGNSTTVVEAPLRMALPLAAAYMWWTSIEPDSQRFAGTFRWTPRRLAIRLGMIAPEDQDVEQLHREHTVRAMVRLTVALEQRPGSRLAAWREQRLIRLGQVADASMLDEGAERVANALGIRDRLTPRPETSDLPAVPGAPVKLHVSTPTVADLSAANGGNVSANNGNSLPGSASFPRGLSEPTSTRPKTSTARPSGTDGAGRADDIARQLRAAISDGRLPPQPKITHVMSELGTSHRNAKAAIEQVNGS